MFTSNAKVTSRTIQIGVEEFFEEEFDLKYIRKKKAFIKLLTEEVVPYLKSKQPISCFISYAWAEKEHINYEEQKYHEYWVENLANILEAAGVTVFLDRWEDGVGKRVNKFIEKLVEPTVFVLVIGTELYLEKFQRVSKDINDSEHVVKFEAILIEEKLRYNALRRERVFPILLESRTEKSFTPLMQSVGQIPCDFVKGDYFKKILKLIQNLYSIDNQDKKFKTINDYFNVQTAIIDSEVTADKQNTYLETKKREKLELQKKIADEIPTNSASYEHSPRHSRLLSFAQKEKPQIIADHWQAWQLQSEEHKNAYNVILQSLSLTPSSSKNPSPILYQFQTSQGESLSFNLKPTSPDGDCFFHAVNKSNLNRKTLVNILLTNSHQDWVRKVFASEIRQFLYLGHSGSHESESENNACQQLLTADIKRHFSTLKESEEAFDLKVRQARSELEDSKTQGKLPKELLDLLRENNSVLVSEFEQVYQNILNVNKDIYQCCCQEVIFKKYVELYIRDARGYISFSRDFGTEIPTTTIDVINQLFQLRIQVYLPHKTNKTQLILANQLQYGEAIPIFHDGINHFWGLVTPPLALRTESTDTIRQTEKIEDLKAVEDTSVTSRLNDISSPSRFPRVTGQEKEGVNTRERMQESSQKARANIESETKDDEMTIASEYNRLGLTRQAEGKIEEALSCYKKALEIFAKKPGEKHLAIAKIYNNLGSIYRFEDPTKAKKFHENALRIETEILGWKNSDTQITVGHLNNDLDIIIKRFFFQGVGSLDLTIVCYEQLIDINTLAFSENNPIVFQALNELGAFCINLQSFSKARRCYERLVEISNRMNGAMHPASIPFLTAIGDTSLALEDIQKARDSFDKAHGISIQALGQSHPITMQLAFKKSNLQTSFQPITIGKSWPQMMPHPAPAFSSITPLTQLEREATTNEASSGTIKDIKAIAFDTRVGTNDSSSSSIMLASLNVSSTKVQNIAIDSPPTFLPYHTAKSLSSSCSSSSSSSFTAVATQTSVNENELWIFLKFVADGEQSQAETMLKQTPALALHPSDVTDLAGRTFKNITGFQYAVWALDWHMWNMIRKYLPNDATREQIQGMKAGSWVEQHGSSASWQNLIDALQVFVDFCVKAKWHEASTQWNKQVGSAQRLLPVHVINEYCHPSRTFEPCPDFSSTISLPRTRNTNNGEWHTVTHGGNSGNGKLGESFAYLRWSHPSSGPCTLGIAWWNGWKPEVGSSDLKACHTLLNTRVQQCNQLLAELLNDYQPQRKVSFR